MLLAVFVCVLGRIGQAGHCNIFTASGSRSLMAILLVFVDTQKPGMSGKDGAGDEEEEDDDGDDEEEPEGAAGGAEGGDLVENEEQVITGGQDKEEEEDEWEDEEEEVEDAEDEADEYLRSFINKKGEVSFQFQAGQGGPNGSQLLSNFVCLL